MNRVREQIGLSRLSPVSVKPEIGVGLLDSGIYMHPDLRNSVVAVENMIDKNGDIHDYFGHGTHVAGIISGDGRCRAGKYRGIAPGAKLYIGKILDKDGNGDLKHLIQGMEWLYAKRKDFHLRVVNISIGCVNFLDLQKQEKDIEPELNKIHSLCQAFYEENIVVVAAAGNMGPEYRSISLLGDSKYVLSIGCHDGSFKIPNRKMCCEYSGRGPGSDEWRKPDLVAPGTAIVSCANFGRGYVAKSGTSMAAPIVSGVAVLALCMFPDWSAGECMRKLLYTAIDLGEEWQKQGWGMVNLNRVLTFGQ